MTDKVFKVGDTIKTQDMYYEFILVVKDVHATGGEEPNPVVLDAEVVDIRIILEAVSIPAGWPAPFLGCIMKLSTEEVSLWEGLSDNKFDVHPAVPMENFQGLKEDLVIDECYPDPVNHPTHYTSHPSGVECIQITEHMGFNLGNALKYVWRADLKNDAIEDLNKAAWYIQRELEKRNGS